MKNERNPIEYFKIGFPDTKTKKNRYLSFVACMVLDFCLKSEMKTLIHCTAGRSRSASVIILYLMWKREWSFEQAFKFVKSKRRILRDRHEKAVLRNARLLRKMSKDLNFEIYSRKTIFS